MWSMPRGGNEVFLQADFSVLVAVNLVKDLPWSFRNFFPDKKAVAVLVPFFKTCCRFLYTILSTG